MTFTEREAREAYAAVWLREMGGTCRELPRDERTRKVYADREARELWTIRNAPQDVPSHSTEVA